MVGHNAGVGEIATNPSTTQAEVVVDELVRNGVHQMVLCPGWRSAPLAIALQRAAGAGRVELHVRIDERSAGFLAVGLAKAIGGPVAVVCTSGTAGANLHPAVLEACHSGTGLLLLTADRPPELRGTGASQTIEQRGLFGGAAAVVDFPVADLRAAQNAAWRGLTCRAVAQARSGRPVQVNLPFREPLAPTSAAGPDQMSGRPSGRAWTTTPATGLTAAGGQLDFRLPARTVMIAGAGDDRRTRAAAEVAARAGWPVIAEPMAVAAARRGGAAVVRCGALLLAAGELPTGLLSLPPPLRPDAVVLVNRPTLSADAGDVVGDVPVCCVDAYPQWTDPGHAASHVRGWLDAEDLPHVDGPDPGWLARWRQAERAATAVLDDLLDTEEHPSGLRVARDLVSALPTGSTLFVGSSNPVRDVYFAAEPRADLAVHANRGVAGIDGNVSTAIGLALGLDGRGDPARPAYALLGDLTFLHDSNGLLIGPGNRRPDLAVVVLNDHGGGNFSLLDGGAYEDAAGFERVFGTPHHVDLAALCAGHGVPHSLVADGEQLRRALRPAPDIRVLEVRTNRASLRELHLRLRTALTKAVPAALA